MSAEIEIRPFDPADPGTAAQAHAIRELVVQPASPWFSEVERRHFQGALSGEFAAVACDRFWVAWHGTEPISHVYFSTAAGAPEVGLLGFVITAPPYRGRGIGALLMRAAIVDFVEMGGQCMQLATGNPAAHRLYEACGFRDYAAQTGRASHVMRWLARPDASNDFDRSYFDNAGPATARPANWGDSGGVVMLYTSPHPWFVRDYPERLYNHPAIEQTRCASILPALMVGTGAGDPGRSVPGGFWVLENPARHIVGAATLRSLDATAQAQSPVLDFLIAPAYLGEAGVFLSTATDAARSQGARLVRACVAGCDGEKADLLVAAGFRREGALAGQFTAGADHFDLHIYALELW